MTSAKRRIEEVAEFDDEKTRYPRFRLLTVWQWASAHPQKFLKWQDTRVALSFTVFAFQCDLG